MRPTSIVMGLVLFAAACQSSQSPDKKAAANDYGALLASLPVRGKFRLDPERASRFAALSLGCTRREYPNKPGSILDGDETVLPPRRLTPAFYGCFDWHSAVHGHWALVRLLKKFPGLPEAASIRKLLDEHLHPDRLGPELDYFRLPRNRTFERPYGWGWLLRLAVEVETFDDPDAKRWAAALRPLAGHITAQSTDYLDRLSVPVRSGTHPNTAFAMAHMLDYARGVGDEKLRRALVKRARNFYLQDRDCPTDYEPSGEDFISPCLAEADLMRRVLDPKAYLIWLEGFLPSLTSEKFKPLLAPVEVKDIRDPRIGHLIGLALVRAWCFAGVAGALPSDDPRRPLLRRLEHLHRHDALQQMFDSGYGGEHWLASFAIYLLTQER